MDSLHETCKSVRYYMTSPKYRVEDKTIADLIEAIGATAQLHDKEKKPSSASGEAKTPLQRLNELFPSIVSRMQSMTSNLPNDCAIRLFRSLRKLQPANNPSHCSILKGIKARLSCSLEKDIFTNPGIVECTTTLKAFPVTEHLKEIFVMLGSKIHEQMQDSSQRSQPFSCSQYVKIINCFKSFDKIDPGISRTISMANERFFIAKYQPNASGNSDGEKLVLEVKFLAKGIQKLMQMIAALLESSSSAPSLAFLELIDPVLNIVQFLAIKISELPVNQTLDDDLVVHCLQLLKSQCVEDPRIRMLIDQLAAYILRSEVKPRDSKFFDLVLSFITAMDHYHSSFPEVGHFLMALEMILKTFRTSATPPVFDSLYAARAKRYGFPAYSLRYALRNLGASSRQVMTFVMVLRPWLEDYGGGRWELENVGRSYIGLRRMRESYLVRCPSDVDLVHDFQQCILDLMLMPFHQYKLKDSFVHSIAKCLLCLDEKDEIFYFILSELVQVLSRYMVNLSKNSLGLSNQQLAGMETEEEGEEVEETADPLANVSLSAWAGLMHGIGRKKHWCEPCSRQFLQVLAQLMTMAPIAPSSALEGGNPTTPQFSYILLGGSDLPSGALAGEIMQQYCVILSSLEGMLVATAESIRIVHALVTRILALVKTSGCQLSYNQGFFVVKGLTSFILLPSSTESSSASSSLSLSHLVSPSSNGGKLLIDMMDAVFSCLVEYKEISIDQALMLLQSPTCHFYIQHLRQQAQLQHPDHQSFSLFVQRFLPQCRLLSHMLPMLELLPLIDISNQDPLVAAIVDQLKEVVLEGSLSKEILYNSHLSDLDLDSEHSPKEEILRAMMLNANKYRGSIDIQTAQSAAHVLSHLWCVEVDEQNMKDLLIVLLTFVLMYLIDEHCPMEWRQCLVFFDNYYTKSTRRVAALSSTIQYIQEELIRRSVRHLETLFGSFMNQNLPVQLSSTASHQSPSREQEAAPTVSYSVTLEQLLHPDSTKLFVECVVALSKTVHLQTTLSFELTSLRTVFESFFRGVFRLPESLWYSLYSPRYMFGIMTPWREIEEHAIDYVKQRLMEANPEAWQSAMSYCLINGVPATMAIELSSARRMAPMDCDGDGLLLFDYMGEEDEMEIERDEIRQRDAMDRRWLLMDLLPRNRFVATSMTQVISDSEAVKRGLGVIYATVLVDLTESEVDMERKLDGLLASYGLI